MIIDGWMPPESRRLKPVDGPPTLTFRHLMMARLMVHGTCDAGLLAFVKRKVMTLKDGKKVFHEEPPPIDDPLSPDEAAVLVGIRRRYARQLVEIDIFQDALKIEREQKGCRVKPPPKKRAGHNSRGTPAFHSKHEELQ